MCTCTFTAHLRLDYASVWIITCNTRACYLRSSSFGVCFARLQRFADLHICIAQLHTCTCWIVTRTEMRKSLFIVRFLCSPQVAAAHISQATPPSAANVRARCTHFPSHVAVPLVISNGCKFHDVLMSRTSIVVCLVRHAQHIYVRCARATAQKRK